MKNIYSDIGKEFDKETVKVELEKQGLRDKDLEYEMYVKWEEFLVNHPKYPKDRLINVTGFDVKNHRLLGVLEGKKCSVYIDPDIYDDQEKQLANDLAEGRKQTEPKLVGHRIDQNMANSFVEKSQVIVIGSVIMDEKDDIVNIKAMRVIGVANSNEKKAEGILPLFSLNPDKAKDNIEKLRTQNQENNDSPKLKK